MQSAWKSDKMVKKPESKLIQRYVIRVIRSTYYTLEIVNEKKFYLYSSWDLVKRSGMVAIFGTFYIRRCIT